MLFIAVFMYIFPGESSSMIPPGRRTRAGLISDRINAHVSLTPEAKQQLTGIHTDTSMHVSLLVLFTCVFS